MVRFSALDNWPRKECSRNIIGEEEGIWLLATRKSEFEEQRMNEFVAFQGSTDDVQESISGSNGYFNGMRL